MCLRFSQCYTSEDLTVLFFSQLDHIIIKTSTAIWLSADNIVKFVFWQYLDVILRHRPTYNILHGVMSGDINQKDSRGQKRGKMKNLSTQFRDHPSLNSGAVVEWHKSACSQYLQSLIRQNDSSNS